MCSILASKLKCTIVDADYRKAPEYPYPAAVEDAEDVSTRLTSIILLICMLGLPLGYVASK